MRLLLPLTFLTTVLALPAPSPHIDTLFRRQSGTYTLPPLPYDFSALEPVISTEIMTLHHGKHHNSYVTNLNDAVSKLSAAIAAKDLTSAIALQAAVNFNGGGHINHSLFWKNLAPKDSEQTKLVDGTPLAEAIKKKWGTTEGFITAFNARLGQLQGSGWGWLVKNEDGSVEIVVKANQDPITAPQLPLIGVDAWEHGYYLQYKNDRPGYIKAIWQVINWEEASRRYGDATASARFGKWRVMRA